MKEYKELIVLCTSDGYEHVKRQKEDADRTLYLKNTHNIKQVLRITNYQLVHKLKDVKDFVLDKL